MLHPLDHHLVAGGFPRSVLDTSHLVAIEPADDVHEGTRQRQGPGSAVADGPFQSRARRRATGARLRGRSSPLDAIAAPGHPDRRPTGAAEPNRLRVRGHRGSGAPAHLDLGTADAVGGRDRGRSRGSRAVDPRRRCRQPGRGPLRRRSRASGARAGRLVRRVLRPRFGTGPSTGDVARRPGRGHGGPMATPGDRASAGVVPPPPQDVSRARPLRPRTGDAPPAGAPGLSATGTGLSPDETCRVTVRRRTRPPPADSPP